MVLGGQVLVKYYGLISDEVNKCNVPRHSFLLDELFRFTQPKFLNDKGSESKMLPYFNRFSPADIEYDKNQFTTSVKMFNKVLLEAISCYIGVFSLCKSVTNELMWTHYASEGKGIAITFKEDHPFFKINPPKEVTYTTESRATITYFKGSWRLNGEPISNYQISDLSHPLSIYRNLLNNGANLQKLIHGLVFSKAEKWRYEEEVRIVIPLQSCEIKCGGVINSDIR